MFLVTGKDEKEYRKAHPEEFEGGVTIRWRDIILWLLVAVLVW